MKKKIVIAIALVLLLAIATTMLVGCDQIFKKNEARDAKQIVASVTYDGITANIYKFELASSFNNYAYAYHNYYGMSYEEAADYILRSLAQQKLLVLYAREKVAKLQNVAKPDNIKDQLSPAEYNRAIEKTNESLLTSLKTLVKDSISEDNYNNADVNTDEEEEEDEDVEVTDAVFVRFYSNGGSAVERQRIQKNTKAKAPKDPTKDGYTFYGWYQSATFEGEEYAFDSTVNNNIELYAKWVPYVEPRTEIPEEEEKEDEDADYDPDSTEAVEPAAMFFTAAYRATLYDEFKDEDFVEKMVAAPGKTEEETLNGYIDEGISTLKKNLKNNLYLDTEEECYNYYLNNQMESLLVTKMQRLISKSVVVTEAEVEAEFNRLVSKDKQTFLKGENAYESALTSSLDTTYYHPVDEQGYGFVNNILLKLDEDSLKVLTDMVAANPSNKKAITIMRNRLISQMSVKVSNPLYKSKEVVKDSEGEEIELRDPMTDPKNPYNNVGKTTENPMDTSKQKEGGNDYTKLISFEKNEESGEYEIVYGATEHPAMAYLLESVPAFGENGVISQINKSFKQVKNAGLSPALEVYWLRQVATKWLYLVGDDSGSVTDSSNNGGLGYLVTPEGKDSSFLTDFTDYARALITNGTGSFEIGNVDFSGTVNGDGAIVGSFNADSDNCGFVVADSFIESGNTSNAYAGVFVLLSSKTVWDDSFYNASTEKNLPADTDENAGVLPMDYIVEIGKSDDDVKTIKEIIEKQLKDAKEENVYSLEVNTMALENEDSITYYKKVYQSLYKGLD